MSSSASLIRPASDPSARVGPPRVLLSTGQPTAISRFVVPVVVDPVNGMVKTRTLTHVGEEADEVLPAFAHGDTPAPVGGVRGVIDVSASRMHGPPRNMRGSSGPSMFVGRCPLARVGRELGPRISGVTRAGHRVCHSAVMSGDVNALAARVNCSRGVTATAARAKRGFAFSVTHFCIVPVLVRLHYLGGL